MKKKVLITGCGGFVGSNLIRNLDKKKYDITCISRSPKTINTIGDDQDEIKKAVKDTDVIVHLAAILNPFDKKIWDVNVGYTKLLANRARRYNKRFIFLSTQNVLFGKDDYSKTKRQAEQIVGTLKNFVIIRPTIIYGSDDKRYIGKVISTIRKFPIVPIIGNGKNLLQPVYSGDLIKIIECCINKNINGAFLVGGKSSVSYNELVDLIIKKLKLKRMKIHIPVWLVKPFSHLLQRILRNPPITTVQLANLKINKVYDVSKIEKAFNIRLKSVSEGLGILLKDEK